MKYLIIFLLLPFLAFSQKKGVSPIAPELALGQQQIAKNTYSVVVGISDYQDKDIPDLRFADKDAEAFANFLRSPAGGALDGDHLKVLTNQNATAGRIAEALDGLIEQAKEGDQVIIYFSGHGDVEGKKISQPGFLLAWDAPSRVYMGGGTYSLSFLQEVVTTLTVQSKAKVTVITDACHAGKLAGSQIGGAKLTTANLAKQYANEVKILSCQPNEFSLEGPQWGGGRGVFSYHLVDGLFGLADRNNDGQITLGEMDRYLEDKVTGEAAPQSQVPILLGNKTDRIATVNANILADLKKNKSGNMTVFAATESRGFEEEILAKVDSNVVLIYKNFKKAILEKRFLSPVDNCAEGYYAQLEKLEILAPLRGIMKRNYAAALQDDAQQTLNEWLKTNQKISLEAAATQRLPQKVFTEKVRTYPRCLDRAAELLGNKHYMYAALKARQYFFEGYLLANSNLNPSTELGDRALALFRQSLAWQPEQPQVYWQMSQVFGWNIRQPDSLEHYARRAMEIYPNWILPCTETALSLCYRFGKFDRAKPFLEQASQIDSSAFEVLNSWAIYYFNQKNISEAELQLKKAVALDSTLADAWITLGLCYIRTNRYAEAETVLKKAIALDSTFAYSWCDLGYMYTLTGRYAEAEPVLKKAITLDSTVAISWSYLGYLYTSTGRNAEAEPVLKKAIALDSTVSNIWDNLGKCYQSMGRFVEAELCLKKSIALDSTSVAHWNNLGYLYFKTQRYAQAEPIFLRIVMLVDSTCLPCWNNLGNIYRVTNRYDESEKMYHKAFALDADFMWTYYNYAFLKIKMGDLQAALSYLEQAIQKGYDDYQGMQTLASLAPLREQKEQWEALMKKHFANLIYYNLACEQSQKGKLDKAFESLDLSLTNGWKDYDWMQQDTDLAKLREQATRWKTLMKKHFPDKFKD